MCHKMCVTTCDTMKIVSTSTSFFVHQKVPKIGGSGRTGRPPRFYPQKNTIQYGKYLPDPPKRPNFGVRDPQNRVFLTPKKHDSPLFLCKDPQFLGQKPGVGPRPDRFFGTPKSGDPPTFWKPDPRF